MKHYWKKKGSDLHFVTPDSDMHYYIIANANGEYLAYNGLNDTLIGSARSHGEAIDLVVTLDDTITHTIS